MKDDLSDAVNISKYTEKKSLFYLECQRILSESANNIDIFLSQISNDVLFRKAKNLDIYTTLFFNRRQKDDWEYQFEQRLCELQNSGFEIIREQENVRVSAISATWGFALECRTAFEHVEQEIIDTIVADLLEITESDFLEKVHNGRNSIIIPFTGPGITPRICQAIREKYRKWTDQGFFLIIYHQSIEIYVSKITA